ncbi:MAG: hypothetical protein HY925_15610 [Elusimicrobia bacterium]|nr:hypothetical protein [Elusimicrobiota bacterium]
MKTYLALFLLGLSIPAHGTPAALGSGELAGIVRRALPAPLALRMAREFSSDPMLAAQWRKGGSAAELVGRLGRLPQFKALLARHQNEPGFQEAYLAVAADPALRALGRGIRGYNAEAAGPAELAGPAPLVIPAVGTPVEAHDWAIDETPAPAYVREAAVSNRYARASPRLAAEPVVDPIAGRADANQPEPNADPVVGPPPPSPWETAGRGFGSKLGERIGGWLGKLGGDGSLGLEWANRLGELGATLGKGLGDAFTVLLDQLGRALGAAVDRKTGVAP